VIRLPQCRYLYNAQQTQEQTIHNLSEIRTRNPSNKAAANRAATAGGLHYFILLHIILFCEELTVSL
jgi:hypothetical protein